MAPGRRLSQGGQIDRSQLIAFRFNGREFRGYAGDTLASALLAHGQRLVARSFKFHRPRGVVATGWEEPNALVRIRGPRPQPLALATTVQLEPGLDCESINVWPHLRFDLGAINDRLRRWLPAGFYYKTFMWPARAWPMYEWLIRRAAGLGVVNRQDPGTPNSEVQNSAQNKASRQPYRLRLYRHTDLLVIGGGVAGLAAAAAAARAGVRTLLLDDQPEPAINAPLSLLAWRTRVLAELDSNPKVTRLSSTMVLGCYDHGFVTALQRLPGGVTRLLRIRTRHSIMATGAAERPVLFADNDRPGVMLCSAVLEYLERYGVACGDAVLVVCNHDSAYEAAVRMVEGGLRVLAIADERAEIDPRCCALAEAAGIVVYAGYQITRVAGKYSVVGARLHRDRHAEGKPVTIDCDLIAMAGGWSPRVHLFSQSGGRIRHDTAHGAFVPGQAAQPMICAGSVTGVQEIEPCIRQGRAAGEAAARDLGYVSDNLAIPPEEADLVWTLTAAPIRGRSGANDAAAATTGRAVKPVAAGAPAGAITSRMFVDFANDVTALDLALAQREGYESVELVKRYTTLGMGVDQGKTSNVNAIDLLAEHAHNSPGRVGTTSFRPPYVPIEFGAIAGTDPGPLVRPVRNTPMSDWHVKAGAVMYESGANWRRPGYYPKPGETMAQTIRRECLAVRKRVGIYDSSPLGKIEVRGPGAAAFLDFVYAGKVSDLLPQRGRYGLMLRDDGRLFDDGVVFCLDKCRYWVSTTAGNADVVLAWLEYIKQRVWNGAPVFLIPVTAQWANAVICGPQARALLSAVGTSIELAPDQFGFMTVRDGHVAGLEARVFRVSFTGELSFEVNVAARDGLLLWQRLLQAGAALGLEPIGSEANHVLRVEKGYLSIGHEADGLVTPHDLGLGWAVKMSKPDFIGRRSLMRKSQPSPHRQLVGLLPANTEAALPEGAQICAAGKRSSEGFVTASVKSVALDRSIALALLENGHGRLGEQVSVSIESAGGHLGFASATVVKPVFYDAEGAQLRG